MYMYITGYITDTYIYNVYTYPSQKDLAPKACSSPYLSYFCFFSGSLSTCRGEVRGFAAGWV